jgi:hypothetical protein
MNDETETIVLSLTLLLVSVVTVFAQLSEKKRLKKINTWANDRMAEMEGPVKILAAHAKLTKVYKAHQSGSLAEIMLALDIDVNDPLFNGMSLSEFDGIVAVRVADLKRVITNESNQ